MMAGRRMVLAGLASFVTGLVGGGAHALLSRDKVGKQLRPTSAGGRYITNTGELMPDEMVLLMQTGMVPGVAMVLDDYASDPLSRGVYRVVNTAGEEIGAITVHRPDPEPLVAWDGNLVSQQAAAAAS